MEQDNITMELPIIDLEMDLPVMDLSNGQLDTPQEQPNQVDGIETY